MDLDATLIGAHSEKEGGGADVQAWLWRHHPLLAFADHGPGGMGEPLAMLLRPGNAGSVRHEVAHGELVASIGGRLLSTV